MTDDKRPSETVVCALAVVNGMPCCWCMDKRTPSTNVVTLWDGKSDSQACDHHVCADHAALAEQGEIPEQHADQGVYAVRGKGSSDA